MQQTVVRLNGQCLSGCFPLNSSPVESGVTPCLESGVTACLESGVTPCLESGVAPCLESGVTPCLESGVTPCLPNTKASSTVPSQHTFSVMAQSETQIIVFLCKPVWCVISWTPCIKAILAIIGTLCVSCCILMRSICIIPRSCCISICSIFVVIILHCMI